MYPSGEFVVVGRPIARGTVSALSPRIMGRQLTRTHSYQFHVGSLVRIEQA